MRRSVSASRTTGRREREREEQQGLSSGNADRLTGLLRPAETDRGGRKVERAGRAETAARGHTRKVLCLHLAVAPRHPELMSAASTGGRQRWRGEKGRERGRCGEDKEMLYGGCGLAPVPSGSEMMSPLVVPSGSRLTVGVSHARLACHMHG